MREVAYYTKTVSMRGKATYTPVERPAGANDLTDAQLVTLAATVAVSALMQIEKLMQPHKHKDRRVQCVEYAILELAKLGGEPVSQEITDYWAKTWAVTLPLLQSN